jgi:hypothetical protein
MKQSIIKILINNKEILGQNRITFYDELIVIEGLIQLSDDTKINPLAQKKYLMKIKFEHGFKVLVTKEYVFCTKVERVEGNDGWIYKYFFKKV